MGNVALWFEKVPRSVPRCWNVHWATPGFQFAARQVTTTWEQKRCGSAEVVQVAVDPEPSLFSDGGKPMRAAIQKERPQRSA